MRLALVAGILVSIALAGCQGDRGDGDAAVERSEPVVVYSARNEQLIGPLVKRYRELSGRTVQLVTADAGPLLERLKAEGRSTPADVLLTVDAGNLWQAAEKGLLQARPDSLLNQRIPAHLRDPQQRWFGLSVRARTIVHHRERVPAASLSTYAALGDPAFKGRLCLRTSKKVYNQSLVAMMIAEHGEARAEEIVSAWVANLAAPPFANDTAVMEAILAGQCDVGIVNTYYYGRLEADRGELPIALFWPDQGEAGSGVHVNVSGGGVVAHSDAADAADAFLTWLAGPEAQALFAGGNLEYPANPEVEAVPAVRAWGVFDQQLINVAEAGRLQAAAVKLMDRAGYR